ncbi:hypothetical protein GE21DRAFT_5908 [Neurospora crassa]|uniref:Disulfide isomerase n=1 Tax=Neurospora crassa (strain ATCC 24698 / 74-OR23-1A / CBS 708.71 / DSM 1257 / FGSC 987) TaxID=367110 RepID=Q7S9W2_NEUCR|nr:disulfide isomerase [Neurospora crassa OR74A]EAA33142.2 disulfide isomerase [Neurospora crassa OR74A]KHE85527.1 hypothetical protein GE21DRAFT_5908 [Neurospora crassa]|eukprot:XP_962378.2 disulfide isomerase [Neurospora crassa OR74A]
MRWLPLFLGAARLAVAASTTTETETEDEVKVYTKFNDVPVPPLIELTPDNWEKESKASKWLMVKHYSPYCPHCIDFAPTYQTLYEFYYTSKPVGDENANFTTFYDFRFGTINCVAYYDLCSAHKASSYPTTTLYKNGEQVAALKGVKSMPVLSEIVEKALEATKPGSRPAKLELPKPGEIVAPGYVPKVAAPQDTKETSNVDIAKDVPKVDLVKDSATVEQPVKDTFITGNDEYLMPTPKTEDKATEKVVDKVVDKAADKATETKATETKAVESKAASKADPSTEATAKIEKAKGKEEEEKKKSTSPAYYEAPAVAAAAAASIKGNKPKTTPNPNGISQPLTAESFQSQVTMTQEPWFIKFYAPWCHHCQAMAANWAQVAREMKGRLNIGEVNCEQEARLCKDVRVTGYPTIQFFRGGERVEYTGLRGLGDFLAYAEKAIDISKGVQDVDAASFKALEEKEEVIFVYFYDHATTTEDFLALERLPLSLIGRAKLVKTRDPELYDRFKITTWPRLLVSREGRPTYYQPLTPNEMRGTRQVLNWMKSVWLPIVPEMTASNAREIMDGKIVVLGLLNRDDEESFNGAIREMKSAASEWMDKQIQLFQLERQELRNAKQLRIEEAEDRNDQRALRNAKNIRINMDRADRKEITFAWVDGVFWQRWIRTTYGIDVKDTGDRIIINDEDNRRYWDQTTTGNPIVPSRTSILETITKISQNPLNIKPKLTISAFEKLFFDIRMTFSEHPYLSMGCILGIAFGCLSWFRNSARAQRRAGHGTHFKLEEGGIGAPSEKGSTGGFIQSVFGGSGGSSNGPKAD